MRYTQIKNIIERLRFYSNLHCINHTCNSFNTLELTVCSVTVARILGNGTVEEGKVEKDQENVDVFDDKCPSPLILSDGNRR